MALVGRLEETAHSVPFFMMTPYTTRPRRQLHCLNKDGFLLEIELK